MPDDELLATLQLVLAERAVVVQGLVDWAVDLVYFPTKILTSKRYEGKIKSFSQKNGYGFISCEPIKEAFGNDVFLHGGQLGGLEVNSQVNFAILLNKESKPQAFDVMAGKAEQYGKLRVDGHDAPKIKRSQTPMETMPFAPPQMPMPGWGDAFGWGGGWDPSFWGKGMPGMMAAMCGPWKGGGPMLAGKGCAMNESMPGACQGAAMKGGANGRAQKGRGKDDAPPSFGEMPGVTDRRFEGYIKNFNVNSGYGFILCDELQAVWGEPIEVFLHGAQIGKHKPGQEVSFEVFLNKEWKPQARSLLPVDHAKRQRR
eukprot:TRINITY_DN694_c4_g1_i1.p1 TRINITY_DN694_c4_g1~~TRINITY_DN694_c4_g1_i1.p1  ORF type:complete len:345 (-),score=47.48 TRINITY_DN694_c4_g1_i1:302-1243(-)